MLREVLIEAGAEFRYGLLNVFVEGRDNPAYLFSSDGFIVRVKVRPKRGARLDVAQLEFHGEASNDVGFGCGDFLEVIEAPVQEKVSVNVAAQHIDAAIMAGGAELPKDDFRDHFCGRLRPALIFVGSHAFPAGTVNNLVRAIESGAREASDQQRDGNRIGVRRGS